VSETTRARPRATTVERRPIGPGLVLGGARGAIAGFLGAAPLAPIAWAGWHTRSGTPLPPLVLAFGAGAGALLGAGEAAAARGGTRWRERIWLFFGGAFSPLAGLLASFSVAALLGGEPPWETAGALEIGQIAVAIAGALPIGLAIAIGLLFAGPPVAGELRADRIRRAFFAATVSGVVLAPTGFLAGACFGAAIVVPLLVTWLLTALYMGGMIVARPVVRLLASALEPGASGADRAAFAREHARAVEAFFDERREAARAEGEARAARELAALERARAAFGLSEREPSLAHARPGDARRLVETLVALGKLDELEILAGELEEGDGLRAFAKLRRGDTDDARRLAEAVVAVPDAPAAAKLEARAVLALAATRAGDSEGAERHLAELARLERLAMPLLDEHGSARLRGGAA
jgi:hypothetical protein